MHEVGRTWATRHGVTLENVFRYVPKSNDPGCSAGFGMGLVISSRCTARAEASQRHPGLHAAADTVPRIHMHPRRGPRAHARIPRPAHGRHPSLQHAGQALRAGLRAGRVPRLLDLAQRRRRDETGPTGATPSPRSVCGKYSYPRPCWYRFFWERRPNARVESRRTSQLCGDLEGCSEQGASAGHHSSSPARRDPVDHSRLCASAVRERHARLPTRRQRAGRRRQPVGAARPDPNVRLVAGVDPGRVLRAGTGGRSPSSRTGSSNAQGARS